MLSFFSANGSACCCFNGVEFAPAAACKITVATSAMSFCSICFELVIFECSALGLKISSTSTNGRFSDPLSMPTRSNASIRPARSSSRIREADHGPKTSPPECMIHLVRILSRTSKKHVLFLQLVGFFSHNWMVT